MGEYIYAVARVRSREVSLLGKGDLDRLMSCVDEEECLQVLRDKGWAQDAESAEELLAAEEEKTWAFLGELTQETAPFAPLLLPVDGNNLKAALKCVATDTKPLGVFLPGGNLDPEELLARARERDFSSLPSPWDQAAARAQQILLQTGDGQLCDVIVDRACLEEILRQGKESGLGVLERYGEWLVATANIQVAVRASRSHKNREFYQMALAPCSTLEVEGLTEAALRGPEELFGYLSSTPYGDGVKLLQSSASAFEKWRDDQIMSLVQNEKYEFLTAGPLFAYAVARRREIDTVRIILSGKRNGLDGKLLRERLRETYV